MSQPPSVYHERQRLELCAVHALNNVLQQQLFSQEAADDICKRCPAPRHLPATPCTPACPTPAQSRGVCLEVSSVGTLSPQLSLLNADLAPPHCRLLSLSTPP